MTQTFRSDFKPIMKPQTGSVCIMSCALAGIIPPDETAETGSGTTAACSCLSMKCCNLPCHTVYSIDTEMLRS